MISTLFVCISYFKKKILMPRRGRSRMRREKGKKRWDRNKGRMSAEGQRRGVGRAEDSLRFYPSLWPRTYASSLSLASHHRPLSPPIAPSFLLCPGPGSIQVDSLGWCPGLGTLIPKECAASCPWRPGAPCLSTRGQGTGLSGGEGRGWGWLQR